MSNIAALLFKNTFQPLQEASDLWDLHVKLPTQTWNMYKSLILTQKLR